MTACIAPTRTETPPDHEWAEATHVLAIAHVLARELHVRIDNRSAKFALAFPTPTRRDLARDRRAVRPARHVAVVLRLTRPRRDGAASTIAARREIRSRSRPPNPYEWSACLDGDRVYFLAKSAVLVGDIGEMSDEQRLLLQSKIGIAHVTPLRTASEWRAAITGVVTGPMTAREMSQPNPSS